MTRRQKIVRASDRKCGAGHGDGWGASSHSSSMVGDEDQVARTEGGERDYKCSPSFGSQLKGEGGDGCMPVTSNTRLQNKGCPMPS